MRFIKNLSPSDQASLKDGFRNGADSRFRIRCQAVLLSFQGKKINELAELYEVRRDTIANWLNRWESSGIEGLRDAPKSGRPPKLSTNNAEHVMYIKQLIAKESQKLDQVCLEIENNFEVSLSRKTLKRFLKNLVIDGNVLEHRLNNAKTLPITKLD